MYVIGEVATWSGENAGMGKHDGLAFRNCNCRRIGWHDANISPLCVACMVLDN